MKRKRIESVDILRAFALILICFYHWFNYNGTYIGVIIFFVLSGYLFLGNQFYYPKKIGEIIKNRVGKLYPSLLFVILITTIIIFYSNSGEGLEQIYKRSVVFSILPFNNIFQIISKLSYFDNYSIMLPFTHLWALSFQFQMYIIGAGILLLFNKMNIGKRIIIFFFFFLSIVSAIIMSVYFNLGKDYSRIYYGTDTRAFAFFISGAFGIYYGNRSIKELWEKIFINIMGMLGILGTVFYVFFIDYKNSLNYNGLMYVISILLSFTVVMFTKRKFSFFKNTPFSIIWNLLIRLGKHQYEYYLWQYPIMLIFNEIFKFYSVDYGLQFILQLLILIILSEITHYIFNKKIGKALGYISFGMIGGLLIASQNYVNTDLESMKKFQQREIIGEMKSENIEEEIENIITELDREKIKTEDIPNGENVARNTENEENIIGVKDYNGQVDNRKILFIGDSVIEMTRLLLNKVYPKSIIDNKVGRQFSDLPKMLMEYKEQGKINGIVVIALGSNGKIAKEDMDKVVEILKGNNVYLVNVVTKPMWEKSVNNLINKTVEENANFYLVDWYGFSKGKRELFYSDGIHPREKYALKYIDLIYKEVIKR